MRKYLSLLATIFAVAVAADPLSSEDLMDTIVPIAPVRRTNRYPMQDKNADTKHKLDRLFLDQSHASKIFPEGCMESYMRRENILQPDEEMPFYKLWQKGFVKFRSEEGFKKWTQSSALFESDEKRPYRLLMLALWGLMEKPEYVSLRSWDLRAGSPIDTISWKNMFEFAPRLFSKGWNYLMYTPDPEFHTSHAMIYSLYLIGTAIPVGQRNTQAMIEDILDNAYGAECSLMSSMIMSETGHQILMFLDAHLSGSTVKRELQMSKSIYSLGKISLIANKCQENLERQVSVDKGSLIGLLHTGQKSPTFYWKYITPIVQLAFVDHYQSLLRAMSTYAEAMQGYSLWKPLKWFQRKDNYDVETSPFVMSLCYIGRAMMKSAAKSALDNTTNLINNGKELLATFWNDEDIEDLYGEQKYPGIFADSPK